MARAIKDEGEEQSGGHRLKRDGGMCGGMVDKRRQEG